MHVPRPVTVTGIGSTQPKELWTRGVLVVWTAPPALRAESPVSGAGTSPVLGTSTTTRPGPKGAVTPATIKTVPHNTWREPCWRRCLCRTSCPLHHSAPHPTWPQSGHGHAPLSRPVDPSIPRNIEYVLSLGGAGAVLNRATHRLGQPPDTLKEPQLSTKCPL